MISYLYFTVNFAFLSQFFTNHTFSILLFICIIIQYKYIKLQVVITKIVLILPLKIFKCQISTKKIQD